MRTNSLLGLVLALSLVAGCATSIDRLDVMRSSLSAYESALRWSQFEQADAFRHPDARQARPARLAGWENLRVSSYDIVQRETFDAETRVTQQVQIKYYWTDRMVEKTLMDRQQWEYDAQAKRWYLHGNLPDFR